MSANLVSTNNVLAFDQAVAVAYGGKAQFFKCYVSPLIHGAIWPMR